MENPTLYQVLGLPPSATRAEIRAAYQHQIERVRTGELPRLLARSIERAYVTLDNPDSRVHYDVGLAASAQDAQPSLMEHLFVISEACLPRLRAFASRWRSQSHGYAFPSMRLPQWQPARWVEVVATTAAMVAGLGVLISTQSIHAKHIAPHSLSVVASHVNAPIVVPSDSTASAPRTASVRSLGFDPTPVDTPAVDSTASPTAASAPASAAPAPNVGVTTVARAVAAAPAPHVAAVPQRAPAAAREAGSFERVPADTQPEPANTAAADPAPAVEQPPVVADAPAAPTTPNRTLVWSALIWGTKLSTHVAGEYCRDRAGGEVFMPVGAPVPANLTC